MEGTSFLILQYLFTLWFNFALKTIVFDSRFHSGFCGFRTNPFAEPLMVGDADGLYVACRLASDDEPERRVWKMTTRARPDRGEQLYQAPFNLTASSSQNWAIVKVPFASFRYVRGPRVIPDGPPLDTSAGLYQIGMSMSKFVMGEKTTEISNFRDGFFELHLKEIGVYKDAGESSGMEAFATPEVYTKMEAKKSRPLVVKVLFPIAKLFFSEQR